MKTYSCHMGIDVIRKWRGFRRLGVVLMAGPLMSLATAGAGGALLPTEIHKLAASDGGQNDSAGYAVSLSGDLAVMGAFGQSNSQGAAYVYERNTGGTNAWGEVKKLTASDGVAFDQFGVSVAAGGDVVVVGANGQNGAQGAAYVYERNAGGADAWGEVKKLTASDGAADDYFGVSVAMHDDVVIVGAYGQNGARGAAYVYERNAGGADAWGETKKLTASDGEAGDYFGGAVGISSNGIVVGCSEATVDENVAQGAAYVYERNAGGPNAWGETKKLTASEGEDNDWFGTAVAIDGDTVVVGANGADDETGASYVFERNAGGAGAWGQTKELTASDREDDDEFGISVAVDKGSVVIGAQGATIGLNVSQGAAYMFSRDLGGPEAWGEVGKLTASDGAAYDFFGSAVSIADDVIVGAAWVNIGDNVAQGAAYLYSSANHSIALSEVKKLFATDGAMNDSAGYAVSLSGDLAVMGAYGQNNSQGAAYVYERNAGGADAWDEVMKLTASDGVAFDLFGVSVAAGGDVVVVGASGQNGAQGAAYVYERNAGGADAWGEVIKLTASDGAADDYFGVSVAVRDDVVVVGAYGQNGAQGAAYVYERNAGGTDAWGETKKLTALDGEAGDYFGGAVGVVSNGIVVGCSEATVVSNVAQGAAYVYERNAGGPNAWGETKKLTAFDGEDNDWFGIAVAIDGDTVVVGANGVDDETGASYVFERNAGGTGAWGQAKKLTASDGEADDDFGMSVAVDKDSVVVGAQGATVGLNVSQGAAYVFERDLGGPDAWGEYTNLIASDGEAYDLFGSAVSVAGREILVGATWATIGANDAQGAAYVFELGIEPTLYSVNIITTHGLANPSAGLHTYAAGTRVTNTITAINEVGSTQFLCIGWALSGLDPEPGSATTCVFTVTNNAVLDWQWATNLWFARSAETYGSVTGDTNGWYPEGASLSVTAIPALYYVFTNWTGDVTAGESIQNPLGLNLDQPKTVTAQFTAILTSHGTPMWWIAANGLTNSGATAEQADLTDKDGDGMNAASEWNAGTDPTNAASCLRITKVTLGGASPKPWIQWASVTGRIYSVCACTNLSSSSFDPFPDATNLAGSAVTMSYTDTVHSAEGGPYFYRVRARLP